MITKIILICLIYGEFRFKETVSSETEVIAMPFSQR